MKPEEYEAEENDAHTAQTAIVRKGRCVQCSRKQDRKNKTVCAICKTNICKNHSVTLCTKCYPEI